MAQSIKLADNTYLSASGVVIDNAENTTLYKALRGGTEIVAETTLSTTTTSITTSKSMYAFTGITIVIEVNGSFTGTLYIPRVAVTSHNYLVPVIYNLTQYYCFVDVRLLTATTLEATVRSISPSWANSDVTLSVYGDIMSSANS